MATATQQPETLTALYRRATAKPCPACNGTRTVTRMERQKWGSSKNWCYTGHLVPKCYRCDACDGSGKVAA